LPQKEEKKMATSMDDGRIDVNLLIDDYVWSGLTRGEGFDLPTEEAKKNVGEKFPRLVDWNVPVAGRLDHWVVDVSRGDIISNHPQSIFANNLQQTSVEMFFHATRSGAHIIHLGGQQFQTGFAVISSDCVTIPSSVSVDAAALRSVLFWAYAKQLMYVEGKTIEDIMAQKDAPSGGYLGDLVEVYKIAKFLKLDGLSSALVAQCVNIFPTQNNPEKVSRQLGLLLRVSQGDCSEIDWTDLYEAVCSTIIDKYAGVPILATQPFAYNRRTWEKLWAMSPTTLYMWGDLVDLFWWLFDEKLHTKRTVLLNLARRYNLLISIHHSLFIIIDLDDIDIQKHSGWQLGSASYQDLESYSCTHSSS
jgi:hypothetical protein